MPLIYHRESVFGYISVLPGAFSAYRYNALRNGPLDAYFRGETLHGLDFEALYPGSNKRSWLTAARGAFQDNMYLAEDRVSRLPLTRVMPVLTLHRSSAGNLSQRRASLGYCNT